MACRRGAKGPCFASLQIDVTMVGSGMTGDGLLAPYVYVQLTTADAQRWRAETQPLPIEPGDPRMNQASPLASRRLAGAALLIGLMPLTSQAQTAAPAAAEIKAIGLFGLLGDSIQVVVATDAPSDTRIERNNRNTLDVKDIGFDGIALRAARGAVMQAYPNAQVKLFRATSPMSLDEQRSIAEGAARAELPAWIVQAIEASKLTHILLITRNRGAADMRTDNSTGTTIGRGTVQGIGFYIDTLYQMRNVKTGALSEGLIAPYAQIKLSLMDTQSAEVKSYEIRDGRAMGAPEGSVVADPWTFLSPEMKVKVLRNIVEESITRAMPAILAKP